VPGASKFGQRESCWAAAPRSPRGDGRVEIYGRARYFTVTGKHWAGQMLEVEEHQADLDWLLALSPHGQKKVPFTVEGKIKKGSQHDTLVSLAGTMRARGCEYPEIDAARSGVPFVQAHPAT